MATYIQSADITDSVIRAFVTAADSRLTTWYNRVDYEVISIAQERNVYSTSIITPLHYKIQEYAICYFCFLVCQDVYGTNNVETPEYEKYKLKLDWYQERCNSLRPTITAEMFTYTSASLSAHQRVGSGQLWRG
jgi:hypothetical protein